MPPVGPIKRKDLIRHLKQLGFEGPFTGGKHEYMVKKKVRLTVPNPHHNDIGRELLTKILRQAGIEKSEWEKL